MAGLEVWYWTLSPGSSSLTHKPHPPAGTVKLGRLKGFHFRLAAGTTSSSLGRNWDNHNQNTPRCSHTPRRACIPRLRGAREPTPRAPIPGSRQSILNSCHRSSLLPSPLPPPPTAATSAATAAVSHPLSSSFFAQFLLLLPALAPLIWQRRAEPSEAGRPPRSRHEEAGTGLSWGLFVAGCWSASGSKSR